MEHPMTLEQFSAMAPEIIALVTLILAHYKAGKRHILIRAPVKSGKRIMVEVIRLMFNLPTKYITSLNRKDVKEQQEELQRYGIKTHIMKDVTAVDAAKEDVLHDTRSETVICCNDECDYGSGAKQGLSKFFDEFRNNVRVLNIYFSATAHETAYSKLAERDDYAVETYVPPPTYCGAAYFLNNNLVHAPHPFFEVVDSTLQLTEHAFQVLRDRITAERHIGIVRVATKGVRMELFKDEDKKRVLQQKLQDELGGKPWEIVPIDEATGFRWEHRPTQRGYTTDAETNYLFVIKQTCGRGTDLKGWHHKLAFWHDARAADKTNLNTSIQAALRPCHYSTSYGGQPQPVRLYVDRRIVQVAVDDDMDAYLKDGGKAPARTRVRPKAKYALSEETFHTVVAARKWAEERQDSVAERRLDADDCYAYRGPGEKESRRKITTEAETRAMDHGVGVKQRARIIPFRNGAGGVSYLVAYSLADDDDASSVSSALSLEATKKSMYEK